MMKNERSRSWAWILGFASSILVVSLGLFVVAQWKQLPGTYVCDHKNPMLFGKQDKYIFKNNGSVTYIDIVGGKAEGGSGGCGRA